MSRLPETIQEFARQQDTVPVAEVWKRESDEHSSPYTAHWCSALVKPKEPETLTAIREHPKLKGYLEVGAPTGYLLIKSTSDPANFVRRCQELGFDVRHL